MKKFSILCMAFGMLFGAFNGVQAKDNYPSKEIRMYVAFGAGGAVDLMARSMQAKLTEKLGQPVLVENYPGAEGRICYNNFLKGDKTGYVIYVISQTSLIQARSNDDIKYKLSDIAFINANWIDPNIICANKELGWKDFNDMIAAVAKNPGKYSIGVPSSATFVVKELVEKLKLDVKVIPYSTGADSRMAFLGGHIDMVSGGGDGMAAVRDKSVGLCTFWKNPTSNFPEATPINDILKDKGITIASGVAVRGFGVHNDVKQNHPERFTKLVTAFEEILKDPEYIAFADKSQISHDWYGPEETTAFFLEEDKYWLPIMKAAKGK